MGGAFTAVGDDPTAVYYNPAGLSGIESPVLSWLNVYLYSGFSLTGKNQLREFYLNYFQAQSNPEFARVIEEELSEVGSSHTFGTLLGLAFPLGRSLGIRGLTVGLSLYLPYEQVSSSRVGFSPNRIPFLPRFQEVMESLLVYAGVGWKIFPSLSVGVGANLAMDIEGETYGEVILLDLSGLGNPDQVLIIPGTEKRIVSDPAPSFGVMFEAGSSLRLGFAFRGENEVNSSCKCATWSIPEDFIG
jgi:hypothetical protein